MTVRDDCRHYATRTAPTGEVLQRCRLDMAEAVPFSCPDDCLFFEARTMGTGWVADTAGPGDDPDRP